MFPAVAALLVEGPAVGAEEPNIVLSGPAALEGFGLFLAISCFASFRTRWGRRSLPEPAAPGERGRPLGVSSGRAPGTRWGRAPWACCPGRRGPARWPP